jgi:TolB protein
VKFDGPQAAVAFRARLRSIVPVDHFELVCDGEVVRTFGAGKDALRNSGQADGTSSAVVLEASGVVAFDRSGWCLVRASSDRAEYPVLENYVYATTSPIYVTIGGRKPRSSKDAKYFVDWMERVIGATRRYPDWNSAEEKELVMKRLHEAKAEYEKLR